MKLYKQVDNKVELCILPRMEREVRKLFDKEIDEGYTEILDDGRIYFAFEITLEKATLLHWVARWVENESNSEVGLGRQERNAS
jgi:hypothetical protein